MALPIEGGSALSEGKLQHRVLHRLAYMTNKTGLNLSRAQTSYKHKFDRKVSFTPTVTPDDLVFEDETPPSTNTHVELLLGFPRSKLLPKSNGPYPVNHCDSQTVEILGDGIPNTISTTALL